MPKMEQANRYFIGMTKGDLGFASRKVLDVALMQLFKYAFLSL
jgi:hypothetical protein